MSGNVWCGRRPCTGQQTARTSRAGLLNPEPGNPLKLSQCAVLQPPAAVPAALDFGAGGRPILDVLAECSDFTAQQGCRTVVAMGGRGVIGIMTWLIATLIAVSLAWVAVQHAVAGIADPIPNIMGHGKRHAP